jgi:hypothetical protein
LSDIIMCTYKKNKNKPITGDIARYQAVTY